MNGEAAHNASVQGEPTLSEGTLQYGKGQDLTETLDKKLVIIERDSRAGPATNVAETSHPPTVPEAAKSNKVLDNQSPSSERAPSIEPSAPAPPRSAWAKDDDKKKGPNTSVSLRAIQEAEAKRLEDLKAAEREKDKGRVVTTSFETKEDLQPFTTSWGLPTSQAGARHTMSLSVQPPPAPATTTPTPPIWTTPLKTSVVKKSMKEIQEEEKRKKQVTKDTTPLSVQRRAYAETSTKARSYSRKCHIPDLISPLDCSDYNLYQQPLDDCGIKWKDLYSCILWSIFRFYIISTSRVSCHWYFCAVDSKAHTKFNFEDKTNAHQT